MRGEQFSALLAVGPLTFVCRVPLPNLKPEQVRRFYTKLRKSKEDGGKGLSSKTIHEVHGVLKLALKNAVRWSYVSKNVCDLVDPPRIVSRQPTPLTLEQARSFLESIRENRLWEDVFRQSDDESGRQGG